MKYLVGSDPEIFLVNEDNTLATAIGIFKGTKEEPMDIGKGCAVQQDNILVEFNIPPVNNVEDFVNSINYSKDYIETVLAPLNKKLHYSSSEMATNEVLKDKESRVFGCSASYNVITDNISQLDIATFSEDDAKMRSAGFHIHIGYDNPNNEMNDRITMAFEMFVTIPLLFTDKDEHNRRKFYGLIGDSRNKPYGVECRSLGGYFLKDDESLRDVWNRIEQAMEFVESSKLTNDEMREKLIKCINMDNTINKNEAWNLVEELKTKELTTK